LLNLFGIIIADDLLLVLLMIRLLAAVYPLHHLGVLGQIENASAHPRVVSAICVAGVSKAADGGTTGIDESQMNQMG
jgi:hypothetical protein